MTRFLDSGISGLVGVQCNVDASYNRFASSGRKRTMIASLTEETQRTAATVKTTTVHSSFLITTCLCNRSLLPLITHLARCVSSNHNPLFNDMKRIFKKFRKSEKAKHPSPTIADILGSSPEAASSTSTTIMSTADPMPSVPAISTATSVQVIQAAGVTVSVQLRSSHP